MNKALHITYYVFADFIACAISWLIINRFVFLNIDIVSALITSFTIIPFCWLILFLLTGSYALSIHKKSRLNEFTTTIIQSIIGSSLIYFLLLFNKNIVGGFNHYQILLFIFITFLTIVFFFRWLLLIKTKNDFFNTHGSLRNKSTIGFA
jgi:hypothetical protein